MYKEINKHILEHESLHQDQTKTHMFPGEALVSSLLCVMFLKYKKCLFIFVTVAIMIMIDTLILMKSHGVE